MKNKVALISNFLLATIGITACLLLNQALALTITALIVGIHLRILKPYEWRLLVQLSVLGWVVDAVFLRMLWLQPYTGDDAIIWPRIFCWTLLASMLCHSLYPIMKKLSTAAVLGAFWAVLFFSAPRLTGQYLSTLSWPVFILSAAISGTLLLLLASFIIRTRVLPMDKP